MNAPTKTKPQAGGPRVLHDVRADQSTNELDHIRKPSECPSWQKCNAPVCPLWAAWEQCRHYKGEPVCRLLRECSKDGHEGRLSGIVSSEIASRVATVHSKLLLRYGPIKSALDRASLSGSRMTNLKTQGCRHGDQKPG